MMSGMTRKKHGHGRRHDANAAAFPLGEYVDGLVERLRELVPSAVKDGDIEAIHQARVATRRLKAAFDLVAPVTSDDHRKPLARTLKKLRRKLGPMRDLDVMLAHLAELKGRYRSRASAIGWLIERLNRERGDA